MCTKPVRYCDSTAATARSSVTATLRLLVHSSASRATWFWMVSRWRSINTAFHVSSSCKMYCATKRSSCTSRRRLQRVQPPTPSDLPPNPARVSRSRYADMAPRDSRSVSRAANPINVTVPVGCRGHFRLDPNRSLTKSLLGLRAPAVNGDDKGHHPTLRPQPDQPRPDAWVAELAEPAR